MLKQGFLYESLSDKSVWLCQMGELRIQLTRKSWELDDVRFQEKSNKECVISSYRKPTQVIWSSRPRYTGNGSLRNSAKKLSVSFRYALVPISFGTPSKSLSTDCLAKTQAPANPHRGRIGAETCPVLVSQPSGLTYESPSKRVS